MKGINGPGYSDIMTGFNQIKYAGTKIQRAFAPSTEHRVIGTFGLLQENSGTQPALTSSGPAHIGIQGLMIDIFA